MANQSQSQNTLPLPLSYPHKPGVFDEAFDAQGKINPQWAYVLESFKSLGAQAVWERNFKAQRILRDDGATYNVYGSATGSSQAWALDLVPSVIASEEWSTIEAGLLERAELFNLFLKDLYGERTLIRRGVLPPDALFIHPGFLRACQGIQLPGEHHLIMHAVDLVRDTDGNMSVLTDRTQSPSGAGYALENRTVMSRVLPSMFRDSHVHRLARFFQSLRAKLTSMSSVDQPRIVVLTPGVHNETYFEHAYLANYLGFHLVQSGDLVVRNGFVWMKSLSGLSRVDVILRRVDDSFCDPVELRGDSQLGVPSLLEVARAGRVVIANPLGSGVLENPVFLKYLPDISKALLGRELRLRTVDTYWCSDAEDKRYIDAHFDELVIKPVYRGTGMRAVRVAELSQEKQQELKHKIQKHPHLYVAQPTVHASHIPTFANGQLQPRPAILRSFAVANETSYSVMPGGLTRVGIKQSGFTISNQLGSQSKDTWVVASEPERQFTNQDKGARAATAIRDAELTSLPSRVVENLFWMGRYAERAEASLRILRTTFMMLNGEDVVSDVCKRMLLQSVSDVIGILPGFYHADDAVIMNPDQQLIQLINDGAQLGSVRSNLSSMLLCADQSKELLSSDTMRVINDIHDALDELQESLSGGLASAPEEALDPLVTGLMALTGLTQESMVRGMGWRFFEIGRRLERGMQTAALVKSLLVPVVSESDQNTLIQSLLLSLEVLISYRRRYRARTGVQTSLDLVLLDTSNPRSLLFQVEQLKVHIDELPKAEEARHELLPEERAVYSAESRLKLSRLTEFSQRKDGKRENLKNTLDAVCLTLEEIAAAVSAKYFDHRERSRQLVRNVGDE